MAFALSAILGPPKRRPNTHKPLPRLPRLPLDFGLSMEYSVSLDTAGLSPAPLHERSTLRRLPELSDCFTRKVATSIIDTAGVSRSSICWICGPVRLTLPKDVLFLRCMRCRNEYSFGAFATNVAARNSPVVQVILKVSDALEFTVNGIRTAVTIIIMNPMLNRNPSVNFLTGYQHASNVCGEKELT